MREEETSTAESAGGAGGSLEQGTYEILRQRLATAAAELSRRAEALNARRLEVFGSVETTLLGNERIRTENNCVPRDIVEVGRDLLFGYQVFLGLKKETAIADVLSLHRLEVTEEGFSFQRVSDDDPGSLLADRRFQEEFHDLFRYYKEARLLQLRRVEEKILAVFQAGGSEQDLKVFRWAIDPKGRATYLDNRGERDHVFPPAHDFEWIPTTRDDHVLGRHPHVSIRDQVFVETVGGDLTIKVEDNTEDGLGIYREPVEEANQSLADAEICHAALGPLILLKVLPYKETTWRYLVFNTQTHQVDRIDAIGLACRQLPEDHGLIFPGGFYLRSGETKTFEGEVDRMELLRVLRSPNGEDVLYVFHERGEGRSILLSYNLIRKEVQSPLHCHGYSLFEDGKLVIFRTASEEPTRVHPMQIWQTPFTSDEHAARAPGSGSFLEKVGNADLVRGISDSLSLCRLIESREASTDVYEELAAACVRAIDDYYWLGAEEAGDLQAPVRSIHENAERILVEFDKVQTLRRQAAEEVEASRRALEELRRRRRAEAGRSIDLSVAALAELRRQRGHLISLRDLRHVDLETLEALEKELLETLEETSTHTVELLLGEEALDPYRRRIEEAGERAEEIAAVAEALELAAELEEVAGGLELLTEVASGLEIDDARERTAILEAISEVLGRLNRCRAVLEGRRSELARREVAAEFGAQFQLLGQSLAGAIAMADTPEKADEQLARLMLQLEDLEGRFGELEGFHEQLTTKREDIYEALAAHKQTLLDRRQRQARRWIDSAERILAAVARRAERIADPDELAAYLAGDAMVEKHRELTARLREVGEAVVADELEGRLQAAAEEARRAQRDRRDLLEEGEAVIRLGHHRFSVNTQAFDLTLVPRGEELHLTLTGTDFHQPIEDSELEATRDYWHQILVSETEAVYRAEYLAASLLAEAEAGRGGLDLETLLDARGEEGALVALVRTFAAERYDEGYERGLHDHDAALILDSLLGLWPGAGLLRYPAAARAAACLFWARGGDSGERELWLRRARSLGRLGRTFAAAGGDSAEALAAELAAAAQAFCGDFTSEAEAAGLFAAAGRYLFEELGREPLSFAASAEALRLQDAFLAHLEAEVERDAFAGDLELLAPHPGEALRLARSWLLAFLDSADKDSEESRIQDLAPALDEAAVLLVTPELERQSVAAPTSARVEGLLGRHRRIRERTLELRLDELLARTGAFRRERVPGYRRFQELRHRLLEEKRRELRLSELEPKVMSSFVRNRLIDQVYLPLVGANLAKQLGTVGEDRRTDQMGLLLLISPPGYGKTTLMEYIAHRLGLVFVKVNGPALGHGVRSIDPEEAPNATARQEVEKISFALEMGNNVLLYLDDIQHTHPELLQKFISLCDGQRRMEGVWRGRTRTYDLRGKRFAVAMAGNPYTESGEAFQIPDMLANRADTYNLGDVLSGKEELFALSFLENCLTSNPVLSPLAVRGGEDLPHLVRMARGEAVGQDRLEHAYSAVELEEILAVLEKLLRVQRVVLAVNREYILSAAQDDAFRTEPPFQLQGSYRNMNKLAEKVVPVMNDEELEAVVDDHYLGEAQTLTTGAEHNLLKLAEVRGTLTPEQEKRWAEIKRGFARVQAMGGAADDPAARIVGQLGLLADRLGTIGEAVAGAGTAWSQARQDEAAEGPSELAALTPYLEGLQQNLAALVALGEALPEAASAAARASTPEPSPAPSPIDAEALAKALDRSLAKLGRSLTKALAARPAPAAEAPPPPPADLAPYLGKLGESLKALAEAPRGGTIVQSLTPGVHDLLTEMLETVGEGLLPLLQAVSRHLDSAGVEAGPKLGRSMDRTLAHLDRLKDLLAALRKIDTRTLAAVPPAS